MNREEIEKELRTMISESLNIEESLIIDSSIFETDLRVDSLDGIEIIMNTEDKFDISIDDEEMSKSKTFKSLVDIVESKL